LVPVNIYQRLTNSQYSWINIAVLDRTKTSTPHSPTGNQAAGSPITSPAEAEDPMCAVLVLDPPPAPWTLADWYLKEIGGVPFLLRNILTIQRAGVKRLIVYHHKQDGENLDALAQAFGDSRINLKIDLITDPDNFADILKNGRHRLLFNGSALHRREDIAVFLENGLSSSAFREGIYPIPLEKLKNLIISNQLRISELEQVIINGQSLRETETGIFLAGGKDSWVLSEADFQIQNERLLQSCGLSNDSFMDRLITRRVSRQFTRFFVRTPLTPNQITGLSLILGLGAACLFFPGNYFAGVGGAGLLLLSAWIDCTDGEVARLKFQESRFGSNLDIFSDNIVHFAVFFSIGMGLYFSTGKSIYKTLGILAVLGSAISFALIFSKVAQAKSQAPESASDTAAGEGAENQKGIDLAAHIANRDFIYLIFLLAAADQLKIFIVITAVGANAFAAFLAYNKLKTYIMPTESLRSNNSEKG